MGETYESIRFPVLNDTGFIVTKLDSSSSSPSAAAAAAVS